MMNYVNWDFLDISRRMERQDELATCHPSSELPTDVPCAILIQTSVDLKWGESLNLESASEFFIIASGHSIESFLKLIETSS